jgi:hypothetical protein
VRSRCGSLAHDRPKGAYETALAVHENPATGRPDDDLPARRHEHEVEAWVTCFVAIAAGEMDIVSDTVARLTDHEAQTLHEYLSAHPESYQHIVPA